MKKILMIICMFVFVIGVTTASFAVNDNGTAIESTTVTKEIRVQQNGKYIDFTDSEGNVVNPQIINDRTMVPFRKIFNSLGVTDENVFWNGDTKTINAKKDNIEIELQIGNTKATKIVSGEKTVITLDSVPVIVDNRTLVPVRFIAESMNKKVGWDGKERVVIIIDTDEIINDLEKSVPKYIELMNEEISSSKASSTNMDIKGTVDYKNKDNEADNSHIDITGTVNVNETSEAMSYGMSLKATGNGELYKTLNESNMTNYNLNIVANDNKLYMKNTELEKKINDKWAVSEDNSIRQIFSMIDKKQFSLKDMFEIDENSMNLSTYENFISTSELIKLLYKDDNIQITENGSTKTCTISINLSDCAELFKELKLIGNGTLDGTFKITSTYKKDVPQSNSCELKLEYKEINESLNASIVFDGKVSDNVSKIDIPTEDQTVKMEEIK